MGLFILLIYYAASGRVIGHDLMDFQPFFCHNILISYCIMQSLYLCIMHPISLRPVAGPMQMRCIMRFMHDYVMHYEKVHCIHEWCFRQVSNMLSHQTTQFHRPSKVGFDLGVIQLNIYIYFISRLLLLLIMQCTISRSVLTLFVKEHPSADYSCESFVETITYIRRILLMLTI
jgi:hypothetical protein